LTNLANLQPGGHLFLSTISRTPLAYFPTIFLAENVLQKVSQGMHTHSKYIKPSELKRIKTMDLLTLQARLSVVYWNRSSRGDIQPPAPDGSLLPDSARASTTVLIYSGFENPVNWLTHVLAACCPGRKSQWSLNEIGRFWLPIPMFVHPERSFLSCQ
jgi:hypothetical protein